MTFQRMFSVCLLLCVSAVPGVADLPPLPTLDKKIELERYAGDWFVHGSIPIGIPFFSDAHAVDYTERYELNANGTIRLICEFVDSRANNKIKHFEFKGFLTDDPNQAKWKVQFVWPIRATYQVIYLDDDYSSTIVATPNRKYAWIMTRSSKMANSDYAQMLAKLSDAGYNPEKFRRIPHTR